MSGQTQDMRYLTFALGKGRLADKTLALLEKIGITCEEMKDKNSRKLIFVNEELRFRFFWQKGRMFRPMWNTARQISAWSAAILFWKKTGAYTKCLTLALANAGCVYADRLRQKSCCSIMR